MMAPDYLKRYASRYRVVRGEDGIWNVATRIPPRDGLDFDVYVFGEGVLAVMAPPQMADRLVKDFPGVFEIHQDATDGKVLLFAEEMLDQLAHRLRIRKRRRLTEEQKARAAQTLHPYRFTPRITAAIEP